MSSSWVPRPMTTPSSSTRMSSAVEMVETRCATMTTAASLRVRDRARRAAGRRSRGRAPRTSRRTRRCRACARAPVRSTAAAAARRTRWCRPARSGRSARRACARTKSARLRDLERLPHLFFGGVGLAVTAGCSRPCPRTGTAAAGRARSCSTARPDRGRARRRRRPSTVPSVLSNRRRIRLTSVVLPAPVLPTIAVVWPGAVANETSLSTGCSAPGIVEARRRSNSSAPGVTTSRTGSTGGTTLGSVSSTSWMRSAETEARGIIEITNVAITTDIRICTRYVRYATSAADLDLAGVRPGSHPTTARRRSTR